VHKLGEAFFLSVQGIRQKREDGMPMLWEWTRGSGAVGEKWKKNGQGNGVHTEGRSIGICREKE
jgi:hypothetical protein